MNKQKHIIEFYGETCPFCRALVPAVDRLEKEDGVAVERLEVWNNPANHGKMEALKELHNKERNGNFVVPSFYDPDSKRLICNPGTYDRLNEWAVVNPS